jgi:hypothetical protein
MIDHHEATANAYIRLSIPFFLCLFHQVSSRTPSQAPHATAVAHAAAIACLLCELIESAISK